jgi:cyclophilin family peptidyl-prolyl cis-trans isomerase
MQALRQQQMKKQRQRRFAITATVAAMAVALLVLVLVLVSSNNNNKAASKPPRSTTTTSVAPTSSSAATTTLPPVSVPLVTAPKTVACPTIGGTNPHYTQFSSAPPMCIDPSKTYTAHMLTTAGAITIKLSTAKADETTVNNFVFLASYHFYDGTEFHRIVKGFVDQGGDPTGSGSGGPGYSFNGGEPSSNKVYTAGAVAMANSGSPSSDGSQFFIVIGKGGTGLGAEYSYVGQVASGMSVANTINTMGGSTGESGYPQKLYKIKTVTITVS